MMAGSPFRSGLPALLPDELPRTRLRALERHEVALQLEATRGLLEDRGRLRGPARERENLAQVHQRVALRVEHVGLLGERGSLPGERLGLDGLAAVRPDPRASAPPEDLREDVLGGGDALADMADTLRVVELALCVTGVGQTRELM